MTWFDQIHPKEKWIENCRLRCETHAVAVLWEYNGFKLRDKYGCITSGHTAHALVGEINWLARSGELFRVEPGGDSLDNPCISLVYTNSWRLADRIMRMVGENGQIISFNEWPADKNELP